MWLLDVKWNWEHKQTLSVVISTTEIFSCHLLRSCFFIAVVFRLALEAFPFLLRLLHDSCNCVLKLQESEWKLSFFSGELLVSSSSKIFSIYVPVHYPSRCKVSSGNELFLLVEGSFIKPEEKKCCWLQVHSSLNFLDKSLGNVWLPCPSANKMDTSVCFWSLWSPFKQQEF